MSIHSRNAVHEILEILEESHDTSLRGVFHCFGGNLDEAKKIVSMGFKLGVGGVITFKNSGLDNIIRHLSLDDLILETDSPYLAPVPHRGKRNESSYIPIIAAKIAELMGTSTEKVAEATTRNATDLFKTP